MTNESEALKETLNKMREKYPNDKEFGNAVGNLLLKINEEDADIICCLCDKPIERDSFTGWKYGHNPAPLGKKDDRCCSGCNSAVVIPARFGRMMGDDISNALK